MRKINKIIALITFGALLLVGCDEKEITATEEFTVTFDTDSGSSIDAIKVKSGEKLSIPTAPTRSGYTFVEWQFEGSKFDFETVITKDITLKATWSQNAEEFTVTFDTDSGSSIDAIKVKSGEKLTKLTAPTRSGYTFVEWQFEGSKFDFETLITKDITLKATWSQNVEEFTVTFDTDGGSSIDAIKVKSGEKLSIPTAPTRSGYTFVEWYKEDDLETLFNENTETITSDITLYAKWGSPSSYTVSYYDGTSPVIRPQKSSDEGVVRDTTLYKLDYKFAGWYKDEGLTMAFDFAKDRTFKDISLYAKFVSHPTKFINFKYFNNGNKNDFLDGTQVIPDGENPRIPTPSFKHPRADGLTFGGWYYDEDLFNKEFDFTTPITESQNVIVKYNVTIALETNGAKSGAQTSISLPYGVQYSFNSSVYMDSLPTPTKDNYVFGGWYKDEALTDPLDIYDNVGTERTLYAKWLTAVYVNFVYVQLSDYGDRNNVVHRPKVAKGKKATRPSDKEVEDIKTTLDADVTLENWYTDKTYTTLFDFENTTINSSIIIFGKFEATVSFDSNEGSNVDDIKNISGEKLKTVPTPTKDGRTFVGWYKESDLSGTAYDKDAPFDQARIYQNTTFYAKWQ